ncbi:UNVERIFIED_CONTAM: Germin-like protein subfamily 3 member 2 [Sesamum angustifolium]|uniref:Germin-like protein n=1 Tax=Sesamum angustifolium TaxID=2727405 RepID=A0AAW2LFQ9_9LAMI
MSAWFVAVVLLSMHLVSASDSDPIQDYCIPSPELSSLFPSSCKNSSLVTVDDFVFSGIKTPGDSMRTGASHPFRICRFKKPSFRQSVGEGGVMVFPRGLMHFQMNVGDTTATILGSFNSQNPGLVKIPSAVFGSDIKEELLEKVFGLSWKELGKLRKKFGPSS